ncbi:hypothetical protein WJX73_001367 [Symbiochloris irregularis]|uniref:Uncharacterized protein n=1 Tax=Symbiochloris irregularis TaxID=706552 RepID=A0AAW1NNT2_9CHLO
MPLFKGKDAKAKSAASGEESETTNTPTKVLRSGKRLGATPGPSLLRSASKLFSKSARKTSKKSKAANELQNDAAPASPMLPIGTPDPAKRRAHLQESKSAELAESAMMPVKPPTQARSTLMDDISAAQHRLRGIASGLTPPQGASKVESLAPETANLAQLSVPAAARTPITPAARNVGKTPANTPAFKTDEAQQPGLHFSEMIMEEALAGYADTPTHAAVTDPSMAQQDGVEESGIVEEEQARSPTPEDVPEYIPRGNPHTPYLQGKIKALQAREWDAGDVSKPHVSRLQRDKAAAAAAKSSDLSSADKMLTKRLVQRAFANVAQTEGMGLGEGVIRHKTKVERAQEEAQRQRRAKQASAAAAMGRSPVPPRGDWSEGGIRQALGGGPKHVSRLQMEQHAVKTAKAGGGQQQQQQPTYMRGTAASRHKQAAGTASLEDSLVKHVSKLEQAKLDAKQQAANDDKIDSIPAHRGAAQWEGPGLDSLPVHKSRLEREQEVWKRQEKKGAAKAGKPSAASDVKAKLPVKKAIESAGSGAANSPRFMQSTKAFTSRIERKAQSPGQNLDDFSYVPN